MNGRFVKENLGFGHITRETVIQQHTRPDHWSRLFLVILVLDGIHIYINKSGNFKFQRQSFSLHKVQALDFLEEMGIHTQMPSFMTKGEKQMPTENANSSRLVTKIRWVVESANARIKKLRYLG